MIHVNIVYKCSFNFDVIISEEALTCLKLRKDVRDFYILAAQALALALSTQAPRNHSEHPIRHPIQLEDLPLLFENHLRTTPIFHLSDFLHGMLGNLFI